VDESKENGENGEKGRERKKRMLSCRTKKLLAVAIPDNDDDMTRTDSPTAFLL
jgi:hypothetical protein